MRWKKEKRRERTSRNDDIGGDYQSGLISAENMGPKRFILPKILRVNIISVNNTQRKYLKESWESDRARWRRVWFAEPTLTRLVLSLTIAVRPLFELDLLCELESLASSSSDVLKARRPPDENFEGWDRRSVSALDEGTRYHTERIGALLQKKCTRTKHCGRIWPDSGAKTVFEERKVVKEQAGQERYRAITSA